MSSEPWAENQVWQHTLGRLRQPERDETTSRRKEKGKSRKGIEKRRTVLKEAIFEGPKVGKIASVLRHLLPSLTTRV